jgi:hypothetical protein
MRPLARSPIEFAIMGIAYMLIGLLILVTSLLIGDAWSSLLLPFGVFAVACSAASHFGYRMILEPHVEAAAPLPNGAPRENIRSQLRRAVATHLLISLPVLAAITIALALLFEAVGDRTDNESVNLGMLVTGTVAGFIVGFGIGFLSFAFWLRAWESAHHVQILREAWPRQRTTFPSPQTTSLSRNRFFKIEQQASATGRTPL